MIPGCKCLSVCTVLHCTTLYCTALHCNRWKLVFRSGRYYVDMESTDNLSSLVGGLVPIPAVQLFSTHLTKYLSREFQYHLYFDVGTLLVKT